MKKILLVSNRTNSLWFFRKEIIDSLIKNNYEVIVAANKDDHYKKFKNYNIKFYEIKNNINSFNPFHVFCLLYRLIIISLKHKPDIIQSYTIVPNIVCPLVKIFYKCKVFCMITGMGYVFSSGNKFLLFASSFIYKISLLLCDHLIFTNKSNLKFFVDNKLYKKNKPYSLIPASGIIKKKYKKIKLYKKKNEVLFLFVGRLIKSKGIQDLIYIFNKLKIINKKLLIIGDEDRFSPEAIKIKNLIKNNKNIQHIKQSNNLEKYYNKADIFLFPSYSEGMPTVVMEAFSCGLPCFVYKVPGCDDIIINNRTGFKVKLHAKDKMVKLIEKEIMNKKKINQISKNCIKFSEKFDRDIVVKQVVNLYEKSL